MNPLLQEIKRLEAEAESLKTPVERFTGVSSLHHLRRQYRAELDSVRANAAMIEFKAMAKWLLLLMLLVYVLAAFGRDFDLVSAATYHQIQTIMLNGSAVVLVLFSVQVVRLLARRNAILQAKRNHRDALLEYIRQRK